MEQLERFDQFFVTIAQETGGIQGLFESMFSFLLKKTDFFYESDPGDKMGFPPGMNVKIMYEIFQKYQNQHYKKHPKKDHQEYNKKLELYKQKQEQEQKLKQEQELERKQKQEQRKQEQKKQEQIKPQNQQQNQQQIEQQNEQQIEQQNEQQNEQQKQEIKKSSDISTYNGGINEKYKWSQNINDLTVQVDLPKGTKAKDLKIQILQKFISVKLRDQLLFEGELSEKIKVDDSFWNIEDQCLLILALEKQSENIWKTIVKGDQEIDTTKVDNSKHLHEFDDETQGALRKIMYEQDRKMKGLPTTEEEQQQELLKKAWNAEGSPFKGTPFDPNAVNIGNQN